MLSRLSLVLCVSLALAMDANAQIRIQWRPGQIVGGVANQIESAWQNNVAPEVTQDPDAGELTGPNRDSASASFGQPTLHRDYGVQPATAITPGSRPMIDDANRKPASQSDLAASIDDVITMVQKGLGESTIVRYINDNGLQRPLGVSDLLRLHDHEIPEPIISAMQSATVADTDRNAPPRTIPPRTVVQQSREPAVRSSTRQRRRPTNSTASGMSDETKYGPSILQQSEYYRAAPRSN